jgi:hypothetical protein
METETARIYGSFKIWVVKPKKGIKYLMQAALVKVRLQV